MYHSPPTHFSLRSALACLALMLTIAPLARGEVIVGNALYQIHVRQGADGSQYGSWNAVTAAGHPVGANKNIMYDQTFAGTNFSSLRIYSGPGGPATYTFGGAGGGTNMDAFFTSDGASILVPAGQGWRTTWNITPQGLTVVQNVIAVPAVGATLNNSAIYHTVEFTNTGQSAISFGWRNLYDWAVNDPGFDDGPANSIEKPGGVIVVAKTTNEFSRSPLLAGEFARVTVDPGVATYEPLLGLGFDPGFRPDLPVTVPDQYVFASWPASVVTAFDYTPSGANVTGDSAGLSWFGRDAARALVLQPGQSLTLTQAIFAVAPNQEPPGGEAAVIPEPATVTLLAAGLGLAIALRRRRAPAVP